MIDETVINTKEAEILSEIKSAEKKADEIIESAKIESEHTLQEAARNCSNLLTAKQQEIAKLKEKKITDFKEKLKLIKEEKLSEGKNEAKLIKTKAQKSSAKAVELVVQKLEEMIQSAESM